MRIALDVDGVLYKWSDTARYLLNAEFGVELGESTHWNYIKENIEPEQWTWLWTEGVERGLYRYGHLYRGARDFALRLAQDHEVAFVTARPESAVRDTLDWFAYLNLPVREYHVLDTSASASTNGPPSKAGVGADLYIDDSPDVLGDILTATEARVILVDRPWNRGVVTRSWPDWVLMSSRWGRGQSFQRIEEMVEAMAHGTPW